MFVLAESVAARLRRHGLKCRTVAVHIRNNELYSFERQGKLPTPSFLAQDIAGKALELFRQNYTWDRPIRSLGVRGADLVTEHGAVQLDMFAPDSAEQEQLERTLDRLRERFGYESIQKGLMLTDRRLAAFAPTAGNAIHPDLFFKNETI